MSSPRWLDYDWIKENYEMIHWFGLGFIQIKFKNLDRRLHFYTKKLPITVEEEEIHNHRYSFRSYILKGQLIHDVYEVTIGKGDYLLTQETCKSNDKREFPKVPCSIKKIHTSYYKEKSYYDIDHSVFHTVQIDFPTITLLHKGPVEKEFADVIYPKDNKPICPFTHKIDEEELWEIVKEMLGTGA